MDPVFACDAHAPDLGAVAAAGRVGRGAELGLVRNAGPAEAVADRGAGEWLVVRDSWSLGSV
ncbi:hypothetical protein U9M48_016015 [Paspalum notatum var. saurae]|uniref:Uncharacterized protein n=1 Tax=Paspalum notatum var. saurae TaxID=547442 RepID=A0AAQ3WMD0_PASNO